MTIGSMMADSNLAHLSAPRRSVNFDLFMVRSSLWAGLQHQVEVLLGSGQGYGTPLNGTKTCPRNGNLFVRSQTI